jgi:hypothetical protein
MTNDLQQDHKDRWNDAYRLVRTENNRLGFMSRREVEAIKFSVSQSNSPVFRKARKCLADRNYSGECGSRLYHLLAMDKRPVPLLQDEQSALLKKLSLTNNAR